MALLTGASSAGSQTCFSLDLCCSESLALTFHAGCRLNRDAASTAAATLFCRVHIPRLIHIPSPTMQLLHWTGRTKASIDAMTPPHSPRRLFSSPAASPAPSNGAALVDGAGIRPSLGLHTTQHHHLSEDIATHENGPEYAAAVLHVNQKLETLKQLRLVHGHAAELEAQKRRCLQRIAEIEANLPYAWVGHDSPSDRRAYTVDPHASSQAEHCNTVLAARHFQCDITAAFLEHHKHDLKDDWREKEAASNLILYSPDLALLAAKPGGTVPAFETGMLLLDHLANALNWRHSDRSCRMYRFDDQVLLPIAIDLWDMPQERHRFATALPLARRCLDLVQADRQHRIRYTSRFLHFLQDASTICSARLARRALSELNAHRSRKARRLLPQELCDKIACMASDSHAWPVMVGNASQGALSDVGQLTRLLNLDLRAAYAPWPIDNYTGCDPHYPCQCRKGNRLLRVDGPNIIWSLGLRGFVHVHGRKTRSGRAICALYDRQCEGYQHGPLARPKDSKLQIIKKKLSHMFVDDTDEHWEMNFMDWHLLGDLISPHGWSYSWKSIC